MKTSLNDYQFAEEALVRARWHESQCAEAVARLRAEADLDLPSAQKELAMLEQDARVASADAVRAAKALSEGPLYEQS